MFSDKIFFSEGMSSFNLNDSRKHCYMISLIQHRIMKENSTFILIGIWPIYITFRFWTDIINALIGTKKTKLFNKLVNVYLFCIVRFDKDVRESLIIHICNVSCKFCIVLEICRIFFQFRKNAARVSDHIFWFGGKMFSNFG